MLRPRFHSRSQELRCSYCLDGLPDQGVRTCKDCGTALHEACLGELNTCPTIGCAGLSLGALEVPSYADVLDRAEAFLRRARADPDSGLVEQAERAHQSARGAYRDSDRAHFERHGVGLHVSAPTRPLRDRTRPRSDRWGLAGRWWVASLLTTFALALACLSLGPEALPLREALCGAGVLSVWLVGTAQSLCTLRNAWVAGSPYA